MVRGRLISLLLLVSYTIPVPLYASDNVAVELKSLQPSYDYSPPLNESSQVASTAPGVVSVQSTDLPRLTTSPSAVAQASAPGVIGSPAPAAQIPGREGINRQSPNRQSLSPPHWLPAAVPSRLMPVGRQATAEENDLPRIRTDGATGRIAMAAPVDEKNQLLKQLYGWSATIVVSFTKPISTKDAKFGDVVEASLVNDFAWGNKLVAPKNSLIRGHITESTSARTLSKSTLSDDRRFRTRGCLGIQFDEIIDLDGHRWPIKATPCRQSKMTAIDANSARILQVDSLGRVTKSENALTGGLKAASTATRVATFAPIPGAMVVTAIATPVAMGTIGAVSPSVAYNKPVDPDVKNRRLKGAAYAFVTNLPGAFFVQSLVEKGNDIEIKEGDTLTLSAALMESGYGLPPGEALQVNGKLVEATNRQRLYPASTPR